MDLLPLFITLTAGAAYLLYWTVRLAVRHGIQDARQRVEPSKRPGEVRGAGPHVE